MRKTFFSDKVIAPVLQAESPPAKTQNEAATWLNRKKVLEKETGIQEILCVKTVF